MQSLILATSLALTTPASISTVDTKEVLDEIIGSQVHKVTTMVTRQASVSSQDTFLFQAKLAIKSANELVLNKSDAQESAAE